MKVLVVYASKMGGTRGVAELVQNGLVNGGVHADVIPAADAKSIAGYDAVIVGSGLYAARWRRSARRFVKRNAGLLREMPVWFFSTGPLDDRASREDIPPVKQVVALMERIGARGHVTFGGKLDAEAKGFPASAMAKKSAGDWRDPEHIMGWARGVAQVLVSPTRVAPQEQPSSSRGHLS